MKFLREIWFFRFITDFIKLILFVINNLFCFLILKQINFSIKYLQRFCNQMIFIIITLKNIQRFQRIFREKYAQSPKIFSLSNHLLDWEKCYIISSHIHWYFAYKQLFLNRNSFFINYYPVWSYVLRRYFNTCRVKKPEWLFLFLIQVFFKWNFWWMFSQRIVIIYWNWFILKLSIFIKYRHINSRFHWHSF
jgi:hypothetical protein